MYGASAKPSRLPIPVVVANTQAVDWEVLVHMIRTSDPAAAETLYQLYADGLRLYLRRQTGRADVEDSVFAVLLHATRAARNGAVNSLGTFTHQVHVLARTRAELLKAFGSESPGEPDRRSVRLSEHVSAMMSQLLPTEREVLLRAYLLEQTDVEIAAGARLTEQAVRSIRSRARELFRSIRAAS